MQQRLLDGYLAGAIAKDAFTAKTTEIKVETERLRERLADAKAPGADVGEHVLTLFDFAQNATGEWTVSGKDVRRAILGRALLKRCLGAASLVTTKRKPFDVLAEGPFSEKTRGDRHSFEPSPVLVEGYMATFAGSTPPHLRVVERLAGQCA